MVPLWKREVMDGKGGLPSRACRAWLLGAGRMTRGVFFAGGAIVVAVYALVASPCIAFPSMPGMLVFTVVSVMFDLLISRAVWLRMNDSTRGGLPAALASCVCLAPVLVASFFALLASMAGLPGDSGPVLYAAGCLWAASLLPVTALSLMPSARR